MSAQAKGIAITLGSIYVMLLAYHKGMLPGTTGPKKVDPKVTEAGG